MTGYKQLDVYKRAYNMAKEVHGLTQSFPKHEVHELGSQLRRSVVSIILNIAEGYGRKDSKNELQHFLRTALGSCNEVQVLLELCKDLGYLSPEDYERINSEYNIIGKQIFRLRESYKNHPSTKS